VNEFDFQREFDAEAADAFVGAGIGSMATYTPPGGSAAVCTVLVDFNPASEGEVVTFADSIVVVTLFKAEVPAPKRDAVVAISGTGISYVLDAFRAEDFSRSQWVCRRG
jgi:hypothetical protein